MVLFSLSPLTLEQAVGDKFEPRFCRSDAAQSLFYEVKRDPFGELPVHSRRSTL
jgi:hypothetical protein